MLSAHYSCRILMKLEIFGRFSKTAQMSSFIKIRLMGAELFNADGQTDLTKLIVAFRNFANAPKNERRESRIVCLL